MNVALKRRLVDTEAAITWTHRPRGTLHRWASEGRIRNYGKATHNGALWDLDELPPYRHLCAPACLEGEECPPLPPPPPIRFPRPRVPLDDELTRTED